MSKKMNLGDRMKYYESFTTTRKLLPLVPVYARLDGNAFHKFTKGLKRPFDKDFRDAMLEVTRELVDKFGANAGYTQSDEISLVWYTEDFKSEMPFGGKLYKLHSLLASKASAIFNQLVATRWPEKLSLYPSFDCRIMNMPTLEECCNMLVWRERDAVKNSITLAASELYSDSELFGKNSSERQELLFQKGVNWNDYSSAFKRGSWVIRAKKLINPEDMQDVPEKYRPKEPVLRRMVMCPEDFPELSKVENKVGVLFRGEDPVMYSEEER